MESQCRTSSPTYLGRTDSESDSFPSFFLIAKLKVCIRSEYILRCVQLFAFVCLTSQKMAEVVQRKLEAMLPELEELQRVGLFTRGEVQAIVRKRRTFEYRMLRRPADKKDFLQAIQVACSLHLP